MEGIRALLHMLSTGQVPHLDPQALLELSVCDVAIELGAVVIASRIVKEGLDLDATFATNVCTQDRLMLGEVGCECLHTMWLASLSLLLSNQVARYEGSHELKVELITTAGVSWQ